MYIMLLHLDIIFIFMTLLIILLNLVSDYQILKLLSLHALIRHSHLHNPDDSVTSSLKTKSYLLSIIFDENKADRAFLYLLLALQSLALIILLFDQSKLNSHCWTLISMVGRTQLESSIYISR